MSFQINEKDLRAKAKAACELERDFSKKTEEYWYNYGRNVVLAKEIARKTGMEYSVVVEDIKNIPRKYLDLLVSFINNNIHYQGKYWTFEEVYSFIEDWQVKKYGQWRMFCKVLDVFDNAERWLSDKDLSPNEIQKQRNQVVEAIQSIGSIM